MLRRTLPPGLYERREKTLPFLRAHRPPAEASTHGTPPSPDPTLAPPLGDPSEPTPDADAPWSFARAIDVNAARRTHARAYEPWTTEEDERAHALVDAGAPIEDIALRLQRPPGAVRARLARRASRALGPDPAVQEGHPQSKGP